MLLPEQASRVANAVRICRARGITQAQIAEALGASQSQVSRILAGRSLRTSRLLEEVCLFVERFDRGVTAEAVRSNPQLIKALQLAWDGTAAHARALSTVIESLSALKAPRTIVAGVARSAR